MEVVSLQEYTRELPLQAFAPAQYLTFVQRAGVLLQWRLVAQSELSLTFQTPETTYQDGSLVTVTASRKQAILTSRSLNEYYGSPATNEHNAARMGRALDHVIAEHLKADRNLHPMNREKYGALVPSASYLVTPLIVYANVLVFIAMVLAGISPLHPASQSLLDWGGNYRPAVNAGEWWRLVSYMFLHAGGMHLLMNTYALLYIGMFLEPLMGKFRFATAYVLTGVCAALLSITMHPVSVCVGASGAIFGMYGVFFSILTTSHIQKTLRKTMLRSILFFIVFNLLSGLQGNTDNAAHIGGLLSGIAIGFAHYRGMARRVSFSRQVVTTVIIAIAVAVAAWGVLHFTGH